MIIRRREMQECYSSPSGNIGKIYIRENNAKAVVKSPEGNTIFEKEYASRKGAAIALGKRLKNARLESIVTYGYCPNCGKGLNGEVYPQWCGFCGRAVKWG